MAPPPIGGVITAMASGHPGHGAGDARAMASCTHWRLGVRFPAGPDLGSPLPTSPTSWTRHGAPRPGGG
eukprot:5503901-Pyramimonas_sp.AAC.1